MTSPSDVIELRPDPSEYIKGLKARGRWLALIIVIVGGRTLLAAADGGMGAVLGGLLVLVLLGGIGCAVVHIRTSVMRLTPGRLEHDGFFVHHRAIELGTGRGLLAPMGAQLGAPAVDVVAVQGSGGETVRIAGGLWTREALEQVAHHAGVPIEPDEISGKEFERRVPGAVPLRFRRPALFALMVGIPLFGAVILGAWYS